MKKVNFILFAISALCIATSCSKDDPSPEQDQEEVSKAKLIFTEVAVEGHMYYHEIDGVAPITIGFNRQGLPDENSDSHIHLTIGKTYRLALEATDFAGRPTQQTFIDRADIHQAFIMGDKAGALGYVYADKDAEGKDLNVGVTGYLTVKKAADGFVLNYLLRHLNPGVKASITAQDWNNPDYAKFTGENDLDLKVEIHPVEADHDHEHGNEGLDHEDHDHE